MNPVGIDEFRQQVWGYYAKHSRDLPWRQIDINSDNFPYYVLVSEFMLQQTQVNRVIHKFNEWTSRYPTIANVANATLADIIGSWVGLGYNRRAKYLYETCQFIYRKFNGVIPEDTVILQTLPGIGKNTAGAIVAYAYNQPVSFIETNIRTVFIHHFFADRDDVTDEELLPYISESLDTDNVREWYWALMDYGTYIKKEFGNISRQSKHHVKQSRFEGSNRQIRGLIIRVLTVEPKTLEELALISKREERLPNILQELEKEGFIIKTGVKYRLAIG